MCAVVKVCHMVPWLVDDRAPSMKGMRTITIAILISMTTGRTAAKSAIGAFTPSKPGNVTVVNTITSPPVIVNVAPAPVVVQPAPAPRQDAPRQSRLGSLKAAASGAVAGAVVGTVVGYALG